MVWLAQLFAADDSASELFSGAGGDGGKDMVVERNCGGMIAAAEARDVAYLHVFGPRICKRRLQRGAQFQCAVEMAAHVGADAQVGPGRNGELEMRVETGYAVNLVQRRLGALGKRFEFRFWQKTVTSLDGSKVVEDHGARLNALPPKWTQNTARCGVDESLHTTDRTHECK